jgi:hypothetical protein
MHGTMQKDEAGIAVFGIVLAVVEHGAGSIEADSTALCALLEKFNPPTTLYALLEES